jgi:hypothetical protein
MARQQLDTEIGREHHGDEPGGDQRQGNHPENAAGIFASARAGESDREKSRRSHQRAGQHREGGGVPGERGGANPVDALLDLHHHHLDRDDGVIDQQTERDDEGAERDAVQIEAHGIHGDEDDGEHQRDRQRDNDAAAPAQRQKAHQQDDSQRLHERPDELADGMGNDMRLVGDLLDVDAGRDFGGKAVERGLQMVAEIEDVAALLHDHADDQRRNALLTDEEVGRVLEAAGDGCDVAEAEHFACRFDWRLGHRLLAAQRAADAQRHALRGAVDQAGRDHGVLPGQRIEDGLGRDAERRQPGMAELDIDLLVLNPVDVDLDDVGDREQPLAQGFGGLFQLRKIGAVAG